MISQLTEREVERFREMGYECTVNAISFTVEKSSHLIVLGNDTWILTGIRAAQSDLMGAEHFVTLASPTDCIEGTQRDLAQMGQSAHRLFRSYLSIRTALVGQAWVEQCDVPQYRLDFIRISPTANI